MTGPTPDSRIVRFATFEVDLRAGEVRKGGRKLKLSGQPFQVLAILLEQPGQIVTREELQKRLWPDTFVDVDHNLNTAINKIREALGDSAENPRFVETLPRRGYRFIAGVDGVGAQPVSVGVPESRSRPSRHLSVGLGIAIATSVALLVAFVWLYLRKTSAPAPRNLTRVTFDDGLQTGPTWSPDSRFLAYSSNRSGKSQIWVEQVSGGDPVQVTKGSDHNWQPEWSPDGKYIAYRSEEGAGGLFIIPALGGSGLERRVASFGYYPHWSPDSSQILFQSGRLGLDSKLYLVGVDGSSPHEVMADVTSRNSVMSAAWHPDGKRITVWAWDLFYRGPIPRFWTGRVGGDQAVQTQISKELSKIADVAAGTANIFEDSDSKFAWAPSGRAIYFERTFHGARNIWRMSIDPRTLEATALERLTTSAGLDSEPALSPDSSKLAFTTKSQPVQAWMFPFDAQRGKILGDGHPITSPSMESWNSSISRDGRYLESSVKRDGKWELWEKSMPDGREGPVVADDSWFRDSAPLSPDGMHLAYSRSNFNSSEYQMMVWSRKDRVEEPIGPASRTPLFVFDWSPAGDRLLTSQADAKTFRADVWLVPADRHATQPGRKVITAKPDTVIWQANFSPNGKWIVFEVVESRDEGYESSIYVTSASGGPWGLITAGNRWDDKPRWSPDGQTIYYISERGGYFNVWGRRFDPEKGEPQGEPFEVTSFDTPKMMVGHSISSVGLSITQDRLVLTGTQVSGSIWVLSNLDR